MKVDPTELYILQEKIGKGDLGNVFKGYIYVLSFISITFVCLSKHLNRINKETKEHVAIRINHLDDCYEDGHDLEVFTDLECPFFTKCIGAYLVETQEWTIMELLAGSVLDLVCCVIHSSYFMSLSTAL